jgi:hypothetical protein
MAKSRIRGALKILLPRSKGYQRLTASTLPSQASAPTSNPPVDDADVEKVAVYVLEDQREAALTEVLLARLADRAGRGVGPECLVVCASIVVAGDAKAAGRPERG